MLTIRKYDMYNGLLSKKVVDYLQPKVSIENSGSKDKRVNQRRDQLTDQLSKAMSESTYIGLFTSGKVDMKRIEEYNREFDAKHEDLLNSIKTAVRKDPAVNDAYEKISAVNTRNPVFLTSEKYLFALLAAKGVIDLDIELPRHVTLRNQRNFVFNVAPKRIAQRVINDRTINWTDAVKLYGDKMTAPRTESVLAGGDASRFYGGEKALYRVGTAGPELFVSIIPAGVTYSAANVVAKLKELKIIDSNNKLLVKDIDAVVIPPEYSKIENDIKTVLKIVTALDTKETFDQSIFDFLCGKFTKESFSLIVDQEAADNLIRNLVARKVINGKGALEDKKKIQDIAEVSGGEGPAITMAKILLENKDNNKNFVATFSTKGLSTLLKVPVLEVLNKTIGDQDKIDGYYNKSKVQDSLMAMLDNFGKMPKVMSYAYKVDFKDGNVVHLNYFMSRILRYYTTVKQEQTSGNELHFMIQDKDIKACFEDLVTTLEHSGIIDPKVLEVKIMTKSPDGLPVDKKTGQLLFNGPSVKLSSPGHGPAGTKLLNEIKSDGKDGVPVTSTITTVDNSGSELPVYTGILQRGSVFESQRRDNLVEALRSAARAKNNEYIQDICGNKTVKEYILDQWDYSVKKDTYLDIADELSILPVTVAIVVEPRPEHSGGGLHVNNATGTMAIIDKATFAAGQQEAKDFEFKFNPMVYAVTVKSQLSYATIEDGMYFIQEKNDKETGSAFYQVETASTHNFTDSSKVLKKVIIVSDADLEKAFLQGKRIEETDAGRNQETNEALKSDILHIAGNDLKEAIGIAEVIMKAQETARNQYREEKVGK